MKHITITVWLYIVFRLNSFSNNLRNELKSLRKIHFCDTGIRNAIINNFSPAALRNDMGFLWENFIISERLKNNSNNLLDVNFYFWRVHQKEEIDYIEEATGVISAYEFK